jgi:UDP-glucose 4-epimerase
VAKPAGKILVTGGAGFIGSHLIPLLLEKGYSVTVFDNLSSGKKGNLHAVLSHPNFGFVRGDIRKPAELREAMKGVDGVVHLAAQVDVSASVANPAFTHEVNVTGTLNVLHQAVNRGVRRLVFASSTAVYGDAKNLPVKESEPLRPISPYAASKAAAEAYCCAYAGCFGLDAVALRLFNVYGSKNENSPYSGVIAKFLMQAVRGEALTVQGDGEQTRDFIHVSDVANAFAIALETKNVWGDVFNVCTGMPISINELAVAIGKVTVKTPRVTYGPARAGDIRFSYGDGSKATQKLGFTSKVDIVDGLRLLLAG